MLAMTPVPAYALISFFSPDLSSISASDDRQELFNLVSLPSSDIELNPFVAMGNYSRQGFYVRVRAEGDFS